MQKRCVENERDSKSGLDCVQQRVSTELASAITHLPDCINHDRSAEGWGVSVKFANVNIFLVAVLFTDRHFVCP